ncbi:sulfite exporter TauE/SafE family protein [Selenomonas sp. KH1T6]|uniref:sulfite exporter TauE/SafE family protein n=1 Tax=Selenomonas sp. KH1T6 TaxID=3158784 RepID=UPI0008A7E635|nr:hypothetical protein SAMN05216583_1638 [Selenomonas ruminantium]
MGMLIINLLPPTPYDRQPGHSAQYFLRAAGNARTLNFASNLSAALFFAFLGQIDYAYALPMGAAMILGAYCGARMALTRGVGYVKPLFIGVTAILIGKLIYQLI